jgi:hypothetical protein
LSETASHDVARIAWRLLSEIASHDVASIICMALAAGGRGGAAALHPDLLGMLHDASSSSGGGGGGGGGGGRDSQAFHFPAQLRCLPGMKRVFFFFLRRFTW